MLDDTDSVERALEEAQRQTYKGNLKLVKRKEVNACDLRKRKVEG